MLRNIMGWGGVGWAGDDDVPCTCTHVGCYATSWVGVGMMTFCALDNLWDATQHHGLGWGGVGMMTFCALDNMSDATQHHGLGWGVGWG